jgi:multiple sugar transport system ATP-binding protein
VFLFDEPCPTWTRLRLEARSFLKHLQHELGTTTVYVTHDQSEALALADRMAVMDAGRVRQLGTPVEVVGVRRPGYAELAPGERPGTLAGRVTLLESLGSAFLVSVESDGVRARVTVPEDRQPAVGDRAFLAPDHDRLLVYGKDDGERVGADQPAPDAQGLRATPP